ncbi:Uncharacterised protein [Pantoea agglomerans]|uniref:Uncharacterized protein n=1 Tax=Enterobacter agglomerans TaxID=549 RepID=A0A379LRX5_ENTAG|nr:Uncharacterised protein [Pantoea agglomerans]
MKIENLPFGLTQWDQIEETIHPGDQGQATWRTVKFNDIRVADGRLFTRLCRRSLVHKGPYFAVYGG